MQWFSAYMVEGARSVCAQPRWRLANLGECSAAAAAATRAPLKSPSSPGRPAPRLAEVSRATARPRYRVVAPDLRCHGSSSTADDLDFSAEVRLATAPRSKHAARRRSPAGAETGWLGPGVRVGPLGAHCNTQRGRPRFAQLEPMSCQTPLAENRADHDSGRGGHLESPV